MNWTSTVLILLATTATVYSSFFVPSNEFANELQNECYAKTGDYAKPIPITIAKWLDEYRNVFNTRRTPIFERGPISMSVETFIALIEKIEAKRQRLDAMQLAKMLLRKFRAEDMEWKDNYYSYETRVKALLQLESAVLGVEPDIDVSPLNNLLNPEENCTMHLLLSHNIDLVAKTGENKNNLWSRSAATASRPSRTDYQPRYGVSSLPKNTQLTKTPREYGVATFRQDTEQAIVLSKLLLGVIAGLSMESEITVGEAYRRVGNLDKSMGSLDLSIVKLDTESKIDPLWAVTLAGVLSYGTYSDEQITNEMFGARGEWNSTLCSTEYDIAVKTEINDLKDIPGVAATSAEIRGAIDGYLIGDALRRMRMNPPPAGNLNLKLSQILRYYYSRNGFQPLFTDHGYCERDNFNPDKSKFVEEGKAHTRLFNLIRKGPTTEDDQHVTQPVDSVSNEFIKKVNEAKNLPNLDKEWCSQEHSSPNIENAVCETPSDVFVMIDGSDTSKIELQYKMIDALSRELKVGRFSGSLNIVVNIENSSSQIYIRGDEKSLYRVAWNGTNKGCATCRLAYSNFVEETPARDKIKLPKNINATLRDFEMPIRDLAAVPSRPFVIIDFNFLGTTDRSFRVNDFLNNRNILLEYHRGSPLIVVGDRREKYNYITYDDETDFIQFQAMDAESPDLTEFTKTLVKRICETPAIFQHPECKRRRSSEDVYTGYVTPGRVQHWAMYPQHFLKSYDITFKFKALKGKLKVCHSRSPKPGFQRRDVCYENTNNEEIVFYQSNPCHKFNTITCQPFYFTIYGLSNDNLPICKDVRCSNLKQIEFEFSHTGISCDRAMQIAFSPLMSIFTLIVAYIVCSKQF